MGRKTKPTMMGMNVNPIYAEVSLLGPKIMG